MDTFEAYIKTFWMALNQNRFVFGPWPLETLSAATWATP